MAKKPSVLTFKFLSISTTKPQRFLTALEKLLEHYATGSKLEGKDWYYDFKEE
jgi:hypothetical protein